MEQIVGRRPVDPPDADLTILPGASHADAQFDSTLLTPTIAWLSTVLNR